MTFCICSVFISYRSVLSLECRQRDMDGVGRRLLDQFKMNQDKDLDRRKVKNKRRKEKRNSTKKELHDDGKILTIINLRETLGI